MNNQIFNADAQKQFLAAVEIIANSDDLTFWNDNQLSTTVEINNLPYELCVNPSFFGDDLSMYLSVTLRHSEQNKLSRISDSIFCEFNLTKKAEQNSPSLYTRTTESTSWLHTSQSADGEVMIDETDLEQLNYKLGVQTIQAQFIKTFSEAFPKIAKKMLGAEVALTKLHQEKVAEQEANNQAAEAAFEQFMLGYRRTTESEAVAMKKTLIATGSVEFNVILRGKPQEAPVVINKTDDNYQQTINGMSRTTTEQKVDEMLRKARIKIG
ncbi:hypothetical protein OTK49_21340 [Vibrio coralliirubri]|uniref:hypothetical protein n=1 Tax=Vibrio coralliirubri TaxID=1516159 RepID=UPI002283E14D|nr:hypothetical protein [Vibrio coralliirubri]MCY9865066.1 hypothetical protein [Vibrio coralliirubri]